MKCQRFLSIPIFSVLLLMSFVDYITVYIFIDDWVGLQSSAGSFNSLIFTVLASLCFFSFSCYVLMDPGYPQLLISLMLKILYFDFRYLQGLYAQEARHWWQEESLEEEAK